MTPLHNPTRILRTIIALLVTIIFLVWLWFTPSGIFGKANAIGFAVCHQISVRSYYMGEIQMPLCARCSGMYIAAVITFFYLSLLHPKKGSMPPKKIILFFAFLVAAWLIDGVNSFIHLLPKIVGIYQPQNIYRLLSGSGVGLVASSFLFAAYNQTVWKDWIQTSPYSSLKTLMGLILCLALALFLFLSNNVILLTFFGLLSSFGVLMLLTLVYGMIWLMITKNENRYHQFRDCILPLYIGFGAAILQIGVLDIIRAALMGGWVGFSLH